MALTLVCIAAGASAGAILRWTLGLALNAAFPAIPPGTLAANFIGGYLTGFALGVFGAFPSAAGAQTFQPLVITGFLGGLTTFSTFTAEVGALLQGQRFFAAAAAAGLHVGGSLVMLFLGMGTFSLLRPHLPH